MLEESKQENSAAKVEVARIILEGADNYNRALGSVSPESDDEKSIEAEFLKPYNNLFDTFNELGISQIETVGKEFDFQLHQALMQKVTEDYEEGIICEEFEKGFVVGDVLIRPALVAVAA